MLTDHVITVNFFIFSGFPVDGILQVEEEEEEVDNDSSNSDDNNTYTVEDDYDRDDGNRRTGGNRRTTGAPLLSQHGNTLIFVVIGKY